MDVGRQADDVLPVVALDQAGHGAELQLRDVGQLRLRPAVAHQRSAADRFHALHAVLRQLHLDLERVAGDGIAPVVRVGEARRRRGRDHRADHVGHGQAELPGALAVDGDVEGREAALLRELQVAQEVELRQLRAGASARTRSRRRG